MNSLAVRAGSTIAVFGAGSVGLAAVMAARIQGDAVPQKFIPKLIKLYQKGRFPFDRLVKFYDFAKINRAIADSKRGSAVKPVLVISHACLS